MTATAPDAILVGLGGDDTLTGSSAGDVLIGDYADQPGLDAVLNYGNYTSIYDLSVVGDDLLQGFGGDDLLIADQGADTLHGGAGDDTLLVTFASLDGLSISGGEGFDTMLLGDMWKQGLTAFSATTLTFGINRGIEIVALNGYALNGTEGDDSFDFSGVQNIEVFDEYNWSFDGRTSKVALLGGDDLFISASDQLHLTLEVRGGTGNDTLLGANGGDWFEGGGGNDLLDGSDGRNYLLGEGGNDTLIGGADPDAMIGGKGHDLLIGGDSYDTLYGDLGMDTLMGQGGDDQFWFLNPLGGGVDFIADFEWLDVIVLENTGAGLFNALEAGLLSETAFKRLGTGPVDADDRILYQAETGKTFYDADGSGAGTRILFATVLPGTEITENSFTVI